MSKINKELQEMSIEQLAMRVHELRKELFALQLNASTAHVKDYSQFKKLRKNIARSLTCLQNKLREHVINA